MEFFIPGVLVFLVAIIVTYAISPHLTPFIVLILSVVFLTFGVYTHYQMFASEYRLSTWQDGLKIYAPAVMIIVIILFLIFGIIALFTGVKVPIPAMPEMPTTNSLTNSMVSAYNNASQSLSSATNNAAKSLTTTVNSLQQNMSSAVPNAPKNQNKNKNKITPSYLETI